MSDYDYDYYDYVEPGGATKRRVATKGIKDCDQLRQRLQQIYEDPDFDFASKQERKLAQYGPQWRGKPSAPVDLLEGITDKQWSMIEKLVAAHDMLLAKKGRTT